MTPKQQFLKTPHAKDHFDLVESEQFRQAVNYAMLEFMESLPEGAPECGAMIAGARLFRSKLETIATPAPEPISLPEPKLHHEAYDAHRR